MRSFNQRTLKAAGYKGFRSVASLQASNAIEIPSSPGLYVVCRAGRRRPTFLATNPCGHFKKKDPTVPIAQLEQRWVSGAYVLYIGKAGSENGRATLRSRMRQLLKFAAGQPVGHRGGRLLWQVEDAQEFVVAWKEISDDIPRRQEKAMIAAFHKKYGRRPFANLAG